ncbi:PAS domain S-box-containing protein [Archangium gephyra]|uniref:histidine kinase n=1 Tax=Archangium gephyra TaxID=48 RepID=A0AAC8QIG8_9BACT|nr:PAS domain-containing protein [Archangium gephyra]AKJ08149.1 Sensor histidine kinase [Archangium gephyra]REG29883.1 PAS domain S-box-containing protein [Archangium gephyra]
MSSSWVPGPELAWQLHAECPDACILFLAVRDEAGALLDFQWTALNPAAEALVKGLCLGPSLSTWGGVLRGLPERSALGGVLATGTPLSFEVHGRLDGVARCYRARALRRGDGFSLWLSDITEVSEQRHALREELEKERAARAREEHLRLALETARMVTWEWSEARLTLHWSPNAEAFFGHPPGGLGDTMETFLERVLPGERTRVAEAFLQGLCAEGPYTFQFRAPWPDGTLRCYEVVGQSFRDEGRPTRMLGVVMDCTEREQSQAALREAEERFRLVSWATNDVVWDWNPAGEHIHWGESCRAVLGYASEEMGGISWWEQQLHPDDRDLVLRSLEHVLSSGGESWMAEYRFRRKDGTYVHVLDRGLVTRDAQGHTLRMIGSMMDITERKRAVERMQEEAQFRERFIGILGHDLRNPLNAIMLSARQLRRRGAISPMQQQLAQRIETSAARMGNMISDILDLTRARLSGGIPLHLSPTSLPAVCRQVVEELTVAHPGRDILVQAEGGGEGIWDPERLAQVVSNLVGNALEHGEREGPVFVRCRDDADRQLLEISNPGTPIPGHLLATLFDPFRQGGVTRSGRGSGLGLGLFIVRELVEAHGGQVTVRSTEEEGTTFTVVLPRDARVAAQGGGGVLPEEAHTG